MSYPSEKATDKKELLDGMRAPVRTHTPVPGSQESRIPEAPVSKPAPVQPSGDLQALFGLGPRKDR